MKASTYSKFLSFVFAIVTLLSGQTWAVGGSCYERYNKMIHSDDPYGEAEFLKNHQQPVSMDIAEGFVFVAGGIAVVVMRNRLPPMTQALYNMSSGFMLGSAAIYGTIAASNSIYLSIESKDHFNPERIQKLEYDSFVDHGDTLDEESQLIIDYVHQIENIFSRPPTNFDLVRLNAALADAVMNHSELCQNANPDAVRAALRNQALFTYGFPVKGYGFDEWWKK